MAFAPQFVAVEIGPEGVMKYRINDARDFGRMMEHPRIEKIESQENGKENGDAIDRGHSDDPEAPVRLLPLPCLGGC